MYQSHQQQARHQQQAQFNGAPRGYNEGSSPTPAGASMHQPAHSHDDGLAPLERHFQIKVHSTKTAANFAPSQTRKGWHTLTLETAFRSNPNDRNDRTYDWANKVALQLTMTELPVFTAMAHSLLPSCEFKNHGADNSKGFSFTKQDGNWFLRMWEKDKGVRAVQVGYVEMALVANLALSQYAKNFENLSSDMIFANLKTMAKDLWNSNKAPLASPSR